MMVLKDYKVKEGRWVIWVQLVIKVILDWLEARVTLVLQGNKVILVNKVRKVQLVILVYKVKGVKEDMKVSKVKWVKGVSKVWLEARV